MVGIRDVALSKKLQMDATLTLEKAKKAIRQKAARKTQSLLKLPMNVSVVMSGTKSR